MLTTSRSNVFRESFTPLSAASPANATRPNTRRDPGKIRTFQMERGDHYFISMRKQAPTVHPTLRRKGQKRQQQQPLDIDLQVRGGQEASLPFDVNATVFDEQSKFIDGTSMQKRAVLEGTLSFSHPSESSEALRLSLQLHQLSSIGCIFVTVGTIPGMTIEFYGEPLCVDFHVFRPAGTSELANGKCGSITNSTVALALLRWHPENLWALICLQEPLSGKSHKHRRNELAALAKKLVAGWRPSEDFRTEGQVPFSLAPGHGRATPDPEVNSCDTQSSCSSEDDFHFPALSQSNTAPTRRTRVVREGEMKYSTGRTIARGSRFAKHCDDVSSEDEEDQLDDVVACLPQYASPTIVRYDSSCYNIGSRREAIMAHFANNQAHYRRKAEEAHTAEKEVSSEQFLDVDEKQPRDNIANESLKEESKENPQADPPILTISHTADYSVELDGERKQSGEGLNAFGPNGIDAEAKQRLSTFSMGSPLLPNPGSAFDVTDVSFSSLAQPGEARRVSLESAKSSDQWNREISNGGREREGRRPSIPSPPSRHSGSRRNSSAQNSSESQKESRGTPSSVPQKSNVHDRQLVPLPSPEAVPPRPPPVKRMSEKSLQRVSQRPPRPELYDPLACLQRFSDLQFWLNKVLGKEMHHLVGIGRRPPVPRQQHSPSRSLTARSQRTSPPKSAAKATTPRWRQPTQ